MAADPSKDRLSEEIETDLRLLSAETRRSEGFTSWLTGPDFPQIKEAAERGVLKLRGVTGRSSESVDAVQKSKAGHTVHFIKQTCIARQMDASRNFCD
jgi:hypothetical protein